MDRACNETTSTLEENSSNRVANINKLISKHYEFVEVSSNITTDRFLVAAAQLCHMDTDLAEQVWLQLFPRLWDILDETQRDVSYFHKINNLKFTSNVLESRARIGPLYYIWDSCYTEGMPS